MAVLSRSDKIPSLHEFMGVEKPAQTQEEQLAIAEQWAIEFGGK
jgi:hypothetical protein